MADYDERYEQREAIPGFNTKAALQEIGAVLSELLPDGMGFAVFLIPHGERTPEQGGVASDCERQGIADALEAWLAESRKRGLIK